jgi:L-asparaginase
LTADDLVSAVPQLRETARLQTRSFRQCPSGDLDIADIVALSREITDLEDSGIAGVVVTQGTDTLEETAFLLDLLTSGAVPVVVTGAMRNPALPGADGPANLLAASQVAASQQASGVGTLVVFNDEIHAARFARKTHTSSTAAFRSPNTGPLGWVAEGRVRIPLVPRQPQRRIAVPRDAAVPEVALLRLSMGSGADLLEHVADAGCAGLVVEAYGAGHGSQRVLDTLERLARDMPVVFASRTGSGELYRATYGFRGSEQDLLARRLISAQALDGLKARLMLTALVASGADRRTMETAFNDSAL